ncbi:MAG TPA: helix-hairpin-helix domain-containing protein [Polyangia bacterium]|nr:helix-hairpin-helix domain-containing protein [Polyangia bacterium]
MAARRLPRPDRAAIAAELREIAARLRLSGDNPFRARAYAAGAEAVESLSDAQLARRLAAGTLTAVPGIGQALAGVIAEIATSGESRVAARLRAEAPAAVLELSQIRGISPERARRLHEALGVGGIDELEAAARDGRVREVKGFGPKTERSILSAIDDYRRRTDAIRLVDARDLAAALAAFVGRQPGVIAADVAGPVRRWQEAVDELAVVGVVGDTDEVPGVLDRVAHFPPLARVESRAPDQLAGRLSDGVRIRVRVVPESRRGVALIEETGPAAHVANLRERARERGIDWQRMPATGEAAVYRALDLPEVPPEARDAPEPLALDSLVTLADIRGVVHCHTDQSDGRHTLEQMARAADARGFRYLTVTDHSPTASYAGGLTVDRLRRQWDEIARVQEKVRVRLLRGTESDILADGALDYPDDVLEQLDVIIASIHGRYHMNAPAMTARLLTAMRLPVFKIWGHPLGQLVLRRPPIACDLESVLDALAGARGAIEISGDPYRLDLPPAWIPSARQRGLAFVISVDAHAIADLDNLEYGVAMARRGGVQRGEVLNALPFEAFRAAVHP